MPDIQTDKLADSTQEKIFFNFNQYYQDFLADIAHAQQSINLETYIFKCDKLGEQIITVLISAAQRNVEVRVLVDGAGTPVWSGPLISKLEQAGVKTRIYHPFPWRLWHWSRSFVRVPGLSKLVYFFLNINTRIHRKVCIIDNRVVYIGSANISACHLSKQEGGEGWRDTIVRLSQVDCTDLLNAFNNTWESLPLQERIQESLEPVNTNLRFRMNTTRHRRRGLYKDLLHRLSLCKQRVWITNAYFVPDNILLKNLIELASKGIDVRILLPFKSDVLIMPWASYAFYERLLKAGVRIFEYLPSMLHAKTLILDDWFIVGSSNLNHRSLLHDLEVDVCISSQECKQALVQQFLLDLSHSREVQFEYWYKRSFWQRLIGRLVLYIKYWI
jgi:cardiolipin synthase